MTPVFLDLSVLARQVHTVHRRAMAGDAGPQLRLHDSSLPAAGRCGLGAEPLPSPRGPGVAVGGTGVFSLVSGVGGVRVAQPGYNRLGVDRGCRQHGCLRGNSARPPTGRVTRRPR